MLTESLLESKVMISPSFFFLFFFFQAHSFILSREQLLMAHGILHNLEAKKINDEKKAALAAQFAAEDKMGRGQAAQKDDDMPPLEAILVALEAELKLARQEVLFILAYGCVALFSLAV